MVGFDLQHNLPRLIRQHRIALKIIRIHLLLFKGLYQVIQTLVNLPIDGINLRSCVLQLLQQVVELLLGHGWVGNFLGSTS